MNEHIWVCKVGGKIPDEVWEGPDGKYVAHDPMMREAVEVRFRSAFGVDPDFCFSGWGGTLTPLQRNVVDNKASVDGLEEIAREFSDSYFEALRVAVEANPDEELFGKLSNTWEDLSESHRVAVRAALSRCSNLGLIDL